MFLRSRRFAKRNTYKVATYVKLLNYKCAHPGCSSGTDIEAHHIIPIYKGGEDQFWNLISLCSRCHRRKKLHSLSDKKLIELYTYKSMQELEVLGFYMDEKEENFKENYRRAINFSKLSDEERLVALNVERLVA